MFVRSAIPVLACWLAACLPKASGYRCELDTDCVASGVLGTCEAVGFCSFPDPSCAGGWRFGELSSSYSSTCVGELSNDAATDTPGDVPGDVPAGFFTIGGTVSGLSGTLVLQNNGGDDKTITTNGSYAFATGLMTGAMYNVTLLSAPGNQVCNVAAGTASGTVGATNVTNIAVTCTTVTSGGGILCAPSTSTSCSASTQFCCFNRANGSGACLLDTDTSCINQHMDCNDAADCGGGSAVCCAKYIQATGLLSGVTCQTSESACLGGGGPFNYEVWCDPAAPVCPDMKTCTPTTPFTGYSKCI